MILLDLFNEITFDEIWENIKLLHPIFLSDSFLTLDKEEKNIVLKNSYYTMKKTFITMQSMQCFLDEDIVIVIVKEQNPENILTERLTSYLINKSELINIKDVEKITLWDDNGIRIKHYGYNFIKWEEILGYSLCPKSLEINKREIISEIFCEMTRFGFDENNIKKLGNDISKDLGDTNIQEEVTKSRKKGNQDNWFNILCDKIGISKAPKEIEFAASQEKIIMKKNHLIHIEYIKSILANNT